MAPDTDSTSRSPPVDNWIAPLTVETRKALPILFAVIAPMPVVALTDNSGGTAKAKSTRARRAFQSFCAVGR